MGRRSDGRDSDEPVRPDGGTDPQRALLAHVGRRTAVVAVVLLFGYLTRPLWHGPVYAALYSPGGAIFIGGGVVAALVLWYLPPSQFETESAAATAEEISIEDVDPNIDEILEGGESANRKFRLLASVLAVLFAVSLVFGGVAGAFEQRTLADRTMADATEVEEFPQANAENPRIVPRQVADITTRGAVSYRQHRLGTSDIARAEDGSLVWSYPIQPDGLRNMLVENQRGVLLTDMTRVENRETNAVDGTEFTHGEGMLLHRSAGWNLKKTDFFVQYRDDPVEFTYDGTPYMYYPKTGHDWQLAPVPHTVPVWEGGALVHPDGTIEHMTPEEAQNSEILDGQRLYPVTLTRDEMGSLGYREGIINQLGVVGAHENEVEVAGLPQGVDNEQPFVIDLDSGMAYVTAMEPFGVDSRGLDEVWFADAQTGEYVYFGTGSETLTGPERAMGIARSEDSQTNWGDDFVVSEPVPVIVEENLWWHIKVAPTDSTDVSRNVFVNADERRAVEIQDDEQVRAFIRGDLDNEGGTTDRERQQDDADAGDDGTQSDEDAVYYILVTDEDGNVVERIPVESGQDTTIVDPDDNRVQNNETGG